MQLTCPDVNQAEALEQVSSIETMPALLNLLAQATRLGFIGVARVAESSWTACAVHDEINFGVKVGMPLDIGITVSPVVIDHASVDPKYRDHLTPKICGFESLVTVPIVTAAGDYFGALFGLDHSPREVSEPWVLRLFNQVAHMVATYLDAAPLAPATAGTGLHEQFLSALAEDLHKPADAICDAAELLEQRCADALSKELAGGVKRWSRRLGVLASHLRDFIAEGSGRGIELRVEQAAELDPLLNRVLAECRHAHPHRRIISNIAVRHPVHCDPDRIAQLVSNLLEAALAQAAPCGPVSIAAVLEDGGLSIDVWNAGEPIPAERVNQLFAPALHAHTASRPIDALSLHACRLIVDAHQGLISVISNKAHGTQCSVWIPIPAAGITSLTAFRRRISETSITHISPG